MQPLISHLSKAENLESCIGQKILDAENIRKYRLNNDKIISKNNDYNLEPPANNYDFEERNNITNLYCGENSEIIYDLNKEIGNEAVIEENIKKFQEKRKNTIDLGGGSEAGERRENLESSLLKGLIDTHNFSCIKSGRRQDHALEGFGGSNLNSILKNMASVQQEKGAGGHYR